MVSHIWPSAITRTLQQNPTRAWVDLHARMHTWAIHNTVYPRKLQAVTNYQLSASRATYMCTVLVLSGLAVVCPAGLFTPDDNITADKPSRQ